LVWSQTVFLFFLSVVRSEDVLGKGLSQAFATQNIVGGQDASKKACAKMAAIFAKEKGTKRKKFVCGGSILNKNTILTAAHCCKDAENSFELSEVGVDCGKSIDKEELRQSIKIRKMITHPKFRRPATKNKVYDICLLKLAKKIKRLESKDYKGVERMKIPSRKEIWDEKILKETKLKVKGWGLDESKVIQDNLQEANVKFRDTERCKESIIENSPFARGFFRRYQSMCAGGIKRDSCGGDSGGPLVTDDQHEVQVGVVSWGMKNCASGLPGVYMNVSHFLPWMKRASQKYNKDLKRRRRRRKNRG